MSVMNVLQVLSLPAVSRWVRKRRDLQIMLKLKSCTRLKYNRSRLSISLPSST